MKSVYVFNLLLTLTFVLIFPEISESRNEKIAIDGYDPVAYFTHSKAAEGNKLNSYQWHNYTWMFTSKKNMELFASNPEKYTPQYDGYCAWAMSSGRMAKTDPKIWKIVNGKLYLNCSMSAFKKWEVDIPGNIKKADEYWRKKIAEGK